jgi:beta-galactosidase
MDQEWRFHASNTLTGVERLDFDDSQWEVVTVPHSVQTFADQTDYSHAWYRTSFTLPESADQKVHYLKFNGVGITADVYLNGQHVGQHIGAYTAFIFDITEYLKFGEENILAVRCDSKTPERIAGNLSRPEDEPLMYWQVVNGIHRSVELISTDPHHIDPTDYASDGVYVTPSNVSKESSDLSIRTMLRNSSSQEADFHLKHVLVDSSNRVVDTFDETISVAGLSRAEATIQEKVLQPGLWSPKDPTLYKLHTKLYVSGTLKDVVTTTIGFRHFEMTEDGHFKLNGEPIRLIGSSIHTRTEKDYHVYTEEDARADLNGFIELGFNSVFLSHYPFPQHTMELINEMGLLAWVENGFVNGSYKEGVSERITREMIWQNYNHPSIFGWSVANENHPPLRPYSESLALMVKEEDSSRLTMDNTNKQDYRNPNVDLMTLSKFPGWYPGQIWRTPWTLTENYHYTRYMNQIGGGSHHAMQQSYLSREFDVDVWEPEGYRQYLFESFCQQIFVNEKCDLFYFWQYKDQECPKLRNRLNSKGIVTFDGWRKDDFYLIKAFTRKDVPVLRIVGEHWFLRDVNELKVYSNSQTVSLTVNGKPQVTHQSGDYTLDGHSVDNVFFWYNIFEHGRNDIVISDGEREETAVVYFLTTPNEEGAPIRDLQASNGTAFYINRPIQPQWPFYSAFDGSSIHTFDEIPDAIAGAGWISTQRQDVEGTRTNLSFVATTDIDVFVMTGAESSPQWLSSHGFQNTEIKSQWRDDQLYLKDSVLYKKSYAKGDQITLETGDALHDYVVLINAKK